MKPWVASKGPRTGLPLWEVQGECWVWIGTVDGRGYGVAWRDGGRKRAHRVVYESVKGAIPDGMQLDHLCRVRLCVNPSHLQPVSQRLNMSRGDAIWARFERGTCPAGHDLSVPGAIIQLKESHRRCRACWNSYMRAYRKRRAN